MTKTTKLFSMLSVLFFFTVYLAGCVNYEQTTKLENDGSGTMKIHYWTKMSNMSMGTAVGKFEFDEAKAKDNFTSSNTEVKNMKVEEDLNDSTKHVKLDLSFKNINEIDRAKGFAGVKASWKESADGMELKYTLLKDTSAASQMGASDYIVTYVFEMPAEIVSTNATKKDGQTLTWDYKVSDLGKDIDMTANVKKSGGKTCGIFGFVGALMLIGLAYYTQRNKRKLVR
jgi:uncharacterized lipoprotein YehR (DUF1307 family)